tara:strand:+ start:338 stop:706 length:369 start_codon:yes stop_codon:yes gene_type:complete
MSKLSDKPAFFVINISDRNVCLSDLALTIPAGRCYDLLNDNFSFTIDQLKASLKEGSLHRKRDKIKIGKGRPQVVEPEQKELSEYPIITRNRSAVKVVEPVFDELIFSDEDYANEMANEFEE